MRNAIFFVSRCGRGFLLDTVRLVFRGGAGRLQSVDLIENLNCELAEKYVFQSILISSGWQNTLESSFKRTVCVFSGPAFLPSSLCCWLC